MLRKYPHHDIPEHMQLYIFYHGLKPSSRNVIDAAAGGFQWSNANGAENSQNYQKQQVQSPPGYQNQNHGQQNFRPYQQATPYQQRPQQGHPSLDDLLYKYIKVTDEKMESQNSALKNLEIQLSQLATLVSEKIQGPLPSNTEKNPKEHLKAIALRSGMTLDEPYANKQEKNQSKQQVGKGKNVEIPSQPSEEKEAKKKEEKNTKNLTSFPVTIPFPQKMKREKLDNQFAKFLEILKQIHFDIPFSDALLQMPSYAKFLKEILSSKRKLEKVFVVMLTEKCSSILQNKLPQKLGDPGSFTIPCTLGGVYIEKALCDSGASINLMPFSIFKKLDLGEMKDTSVSLQFAVKECADEPIILGRPFLATGRAIIDVHQGQLILRVDEERVIFDMQKILRFSEDDTPSSCFSVDMINNLIDEFKDDQLISDSMERCLVKYGTTQDEDPTIKNDAKLLEKDYEEGDMQLEEVQPKIELKTLPSHLKYVYLEHELFSVIISSSLTTEQEERLIEVLKSHKGALGWTVEDIKGINPAICTHRILMEDSYKPIVQTQRRLNPAMQEVVKKEILKLLAAGIIYPISDSPWVSPVQVVPKKGGYNQIPIAPKDQDKTTFTCPHGTYSYRRMPFGDCMKAFDTLKEKLSTAPIIVSPDWNQPFEVMYDASDTAVGSVLGQRKDKEKEYMEKEKKKDLRFKEEGCIRDNFI
ncbi:PREDICTED: uncharacterized protein LOC109219101 [Nicotiana attenuata]|uniref:uncharacterized protein LOC109219101 n=1 Tax=Nicotiana attenuata TaxID=49451 RepID=UPI000904D587|nr:PREDICTED: uncharacterized protein LOC109219101 [Nicotiana attenuata]